MAFVEERFIEIQPNSSDHKTEHPYNLTMAKCLPSDLYFTISRLNEDEDYGYYGEADDDFLPELYFLRVTCGQGSDLRFAMSEGNNVEDEVDSSMKEVFPAKASSGGKSMRPVF